MTDLRPDVDDEEARAPNAAEPEDEDAVNTDGFDTDGYRTRFVKDGDDGERRRRVSECRVSDET